MRFLTSVVNLVRRKRLHTGALKNKKTEGTITVSQSQTAIIGEGMFRSPILWKTADGKWHRHQLHIFRSHDRSNWFSLTRNYVEVALHNSSQLMYTTYDGSKLTVHLIFVSGVLSLRFPSQLHTEQYFAWASGAGIRATGSIFAAQLYRRFDEIRNSRNVLLITKDTSLVIVDESRNAPFLFTTVQLIRAVTVRGNSLAILSAIPGNDYFLLCENAKDVRSWYETHTVKKQRQKILNYRVSKPRSRVGRPKMGITVSRRKKASEASYELFRRLR